MGQVLAGGDSRPITADELRAIGQMQQAMTQIPVPTLRHADGPHEYLFFAFNDGSGQDLNKPKLGLPTNVGTLYEQAQVLEDDPNNRIGTHYAAGIGSQSFAPARVLDGALAVTWADGIEEMYLEFAKQSERWLRQDSEAKIRVAGLGYSRGAVQEAGFNRLVDQYGIADWRDLKFGRDEHGNITVESRLPPLVPPGQVAQATFLLDPVATNMPRNYDARLPGSAISRVSLLAATEQRKLFPHRAINDPGMSADGLALNVPVPGGHSNIGGGNKEPGVEILVGNMAVDYLNLLSDKPLFEKRPVPQDLSAFTIYQAQGATAGWGHKMDRDGERNLRNDLANCKIVDPCRDSEPVNRELAAKFEYRHIQLDPREQAQLQGLIAQASAREQIAPQAPAPDRTVAVQQAGLIQLGYHHHISQPLQVNGTFDDATRQAVTAFQAQHDLQISGTFDPATQHALQQALQAQQLQQQGVETREREAEQVRKAEQDRADERSAQRLPFSHPDHPQHALYADVQQRFQAKGHTLSEAQLSVLTGQMHATGAMPGWQGDVTVRDGRAFAMAVWPPGMRANIDLGTPAPSVQDTMQDFQVAQQSMEKHMEMLNQQQAMAQEHGHGLSR